MTADELIAQITALDDQMRGLLMVRGQALVALSRADYDRYCMLTNKVRMAMRTQQTAGNVEGSHRIADLEATFETILASRPTADLEQLLSVDRFCHSPCDLNIRDVVIGGPSPVVIAGPCAIETEDQLRSVAAELNQHGIRILRGGAFKPRTSPYAFQGLGEEGLAYLQRVAGDFGMVSITEVLDPRDVQLVSSYADILQVGSRNMANYALLKEVGRARCPVMLKRGMSATISESALAAEYIKVQGNCQVMLCERGIRTFETQTRNTLDVAAIPLLREKTGLPVIADVSHSGGRRSLAAPLARASLAAGAQGVMVEVHPAPECALSDPEQQLDFADFRNFMAAIRPLLCPQ